MKRVIAAIAGFALPAIAGAYVALAPGGGSLAPLDRVAARIAEAAGRDVAVAGFLMLGLLLAAAAALLIGRSGGQETAEEEAQEETREAEADERGPLLLTREIEQEEESALTAAAAPLPPAIVLVRKPRDLARDWFADTSWLGGLPRLGERAWPRDANGTPLPFAAQIDLAHLARAAPHAGLPTTGSLAFFLGAGAVVFVPAGAHDFSDPPSDLPPAFDEGGAAFPSRVTRLTRWFFPFWPIDLLPLDLPGHRDAAGGAATPGSMEEAVALQLQRRVPMRDHPFYAAGVGAPVEALWWHSVGHLADQLHEALDACSRPLAVQRAAVDRKRAAVAQLQADPAISHEAVEHARQAADDAAEELTEAQNLCAALPDMVEAVDRFIEGREPWSRLTADELEVVADILAEVHERFGELVRYHVPGSLAQLATLSLRAMVAGPPEALAAVPGEVLHRINRDYRLPPVHQHLMFAERGPGQTEGLLLLQLGYDDLMEWHWAEGGRYRFQIDAADLIAGNWDAARLTFDEQ